MVARLSRGANQRIAVGQKKPQVVAYEQGGHRSAEGEIVAVCIVKCVGGVHEGQTQAPRRAFASPAEAVFGVSVDDVELFLTDFALHGSRAHQPQSETTGAVEGEGGKAVNRAILFRVAWSGYCKDEDLVVPLLQPLLELEQRSDDTASGRLVAIGKESDLHAGARCCSLSNFSPVASSTHL